jgi:hypothetical protein
MKNDIKIELYNTLNTLVAQRELWENGTYKQANSELYAILEQCGEIYTALKADKKTARIFNAVAAELGISFNKGTSLALKIVRVVFGAQSNREFAYARVIKVWFVERTDGQTLTNYVIEQGGVENVRRNASKQTTDTLSADDYREIAAEAFEGGHALATFSVEDYMLSDDENDTDYMVALVRCDGKGDGVVLGGSNKRMLVNTALAVLGKDINDLQKATNSTGAQNSKRTEAVNNITQFVAKRQQKKAAA